jgi:hypothetical protein
MASSQFCKIYSYNWAKLNLVGKCTFLTCKHGETHQAFQLQGCCDWSVSVENHMRKNIGKHWMARGCEGMPNCRIDLFAPLDGDKVQIDQKYLLLN